MRKERIVTGEEKRAILKHLQARGDLPSFEKLRKLWTLRGHRGRPGRKTWAQEAGFFIAARQFKVLPKRMGFIPPAKRIQLPDYPEVPSKNFSSSTSGRRPEGVQNRAPSANSPAAVSRQDSTPVPTETQPPMPAPPPAPSLAPDAPAKTQVSLLERVEWVFEHLGEKYPNAEDAPTPGTWAMFMVYNEDDQTRQLFYKDFAVKLLPNKAALDIETQRYDKGEVALSFLAECQAASQRAKRVVSESLPSQN